MDLNMACRHRAGHKVDKPKTKRTVGALPVVISKKTLEGIVSRSRQQEKQDEQAAIDEELRYKQYLKDGNDALMKRFTNLSVLEDTGDDELQAARDTLLAEKTKDLETLHLLSEKRKESIMQAKRILYSLKPGPKTLRGALVISELAHQRHANDALKKEIIEDAQRQQRFDEQQCSGWVIPTGYVTEEQEKTEQKEKSLKLAEDYRLDLEERRQRRLAEKQEKTSEIILERALYKILQELEQMKAKEVAEKKREFCRQAYRDSLQEKAAKAQAEKIQEEIEDRINCVSCVTRRNLDMGFKKQTETIREDQHRSREIRARSIHELQQRGKMTRERQQETHEEREAAMLVIDKARRQCELEQLAKQRRAYEQVERQQGEEKRLKEAEVRRFQVATRYRNAEVNKVFFNREKAQKKKVQDNMRKFLHGQRDEFLEKRQTESMRMTDCQEDPYLQDDVDFFQGAVDLMQESKKLGRPLYPLAKAAEVYKRENQVDMVPEGPMLHRNTKRDSCWPGYYGKAKLAFRNYEHREQCRRQMEEKRHNIFDNCIKIQSMAAAENPVKPCLPGGIIKCFRNNETNIEPSQESLEFPVELRLSNTPLKLAKTPTNTLATLENTSPIKSKVCTKRTLKQTLTKKMSMESCNRCTGGRNSVPTGLAKPCLKVPDLQHCWTPRPQVTNRPPIPQTTNRPYSTPATLSTNVSDQSPNSKSFRKKID